MKILALYANENGEHVTCVLENVGILGLDELDLTSILPFFNEGCTLFLIHNFNELDEVTDGYGQPVVRHRVTLKD